jgi:allophanate hydrolase
MSGPFAESDASSLLIRDLIVNYRAGRFSVVERLERVLDNISRAPERHIWIRLLPRERVLEMARALASKAPESLPLYGVPFAIKDNIDLGGVPTTAGCPDYAYMPGESAPVVQKLIDAGAIPVGKTNLDQFATGLVGTRSPHGACQNSFDPAYIAGGSSSGSAVAVASGLVSFALGTDTAGSGRVPAAFNNLIGLKPTCGALSTRGVVPACRSLDAVSIFALCADDAASVYFAARGYDPQDPYSLTRTACFGSQEAREDGLRSAIGKGLWSAPGGTLQAVRVGIPRASQLNFFGDTEYARLFTETVVRLESLGAVRVEIDFEPFLAAARLLYEGPWVAERYCAVGDFLEQHPESVFAVTRQIIAGGRIPTAADAFRAQYKLMELKRVAQKSWAGMDVLVTPTAGTVYRIDEVNGDPVRLNSNLGYYTNFVNLLDLAAVAAPAGFRGDGLPFGITLVGRAGSDEELLRLADVVQRACVDRIGALGVPLPAPRTGFEPVGAQAHMGGAGGGNQGGGGAPGVDGGVDVGGSARAGGGAMIRAAIGADVVASAGAADVDSGDRIAVAVCGAHMQGLPLNHQLTSRGAVFVQRTRTVPAYKLYALPGSPPHRPGMIRVASGGAAIEVEVWSVPSASFGGFVAGIDAPLGIGKVELAGGNRVSGFVCESYAADGARDITSLGGWRRYLDTVTIGQ